MASGVAKPLRVFGPSAVSRCHVACGSTSTPRRSIRVATVRVGSVLTTFTKIREPSPDRLTTESVVRHIEGVQQCQAEIDALKASIKWELACLSQSLLPKPVEIRGFISWRTVRVQLVKRKINEHGGLFDDSL